MWKSRKLLVGVKTGGDGVGDRIKVFPIAKKIGISLGVSAQRHIFAGLHYLHDRLRKQQIRVQKMRDHKSLASTIASCF